ncbi:putative transcription factor AS2-LOB family [Rosa chinensis]|uniref:Putative transcription factor AS2-LOB family n=1 Tax=Rosa chinensis TaxID=74649 RepID=A0A2P6Q0V7_ROSCH|nr:LOB domain-containing protein 39 [Rosa chinensis]PRQ27820.1 putative transcription factor AS2-LOB family [Rosa chinensis]
MSCNGCRVLRKGCSETCILRSCLRLIDCPESQGNATLFLAKFFGRSDLLSFISAVPENQRPALFQSLLFEACGRTVNPVSGAVGLLSSGNWHVCHAAVQAVLSGGVLRPLPAISTPKLEESSVTFDRGACGIQDLHYTSVPSMFYDDVERSQPLDVALSLKPNLAAAAAGGRGRARGRSCAIERSMRDTVSFNSEDSIMTTSAGGGDSNGDRKLLNLFV